MSEEKSSYDTPEGGSKAIDKLWFDPMGRPRPQGAAEEQPRQGMGGITPEGGSRAAGGLLPRPPCAQCGHLETNHGPRGCLGCFQDPLSFNCDGYEPLQDERDLHALAHEPDYATEDAHRKSLRWHALYAALRACEAECEERSGAQPGFAEFGVARDTLRDAIAQLDREQ